MRAIVYTRYGPPDVLQLKDLPKPTPKANEVLIKIHATTLNRTDVGFRKPEYPLIIRPLQGLIRPRRQILGSELAGVIEAVGKDVTAFKPGDAVFGLSTWNFGTHADYICMDEHASLALKPTNMSFDEAAAVCDGLILGMNLAGKIDYTKAKDVLVNGATGSIGSACVQLARHFGARVTAVCKAEHFDLVKSLGASDVIDYTQEDFTKGGRQVEVVVDAVGKSSFFKCRKLLKPGGTYFSTELGFLMQNIWLALITPWLGGRKVLFPVPKDSQKDIRYFKELIEAGHYKAVIDRRYPLEQIVAAARYVETGEKIGNVVLTTTPA